jgi:hypothetical protein
MITRLAVAAALAIGVAGCAHKDLGGSIDGGECKAFERPPYAVRGQKPYDQDWIDSTVESGVGACKWQRPSPRPPEIDAVPTAKPVQPPAKRGLIARLKKRVWPRSVVAPIAAVPPLRPELPAPPPVAEMPPSDLPPQTPPAPPPAKKSALTALEELLHLRSGE